MLKGNSWLSGKGAAAAIGGQCCEEGTQRQKREEGTHRQEEQRWLKVEDNLHMAANKTGGM
jgi:hypothetical protein